MDNQQLSDQHIEDLIMRYKEYDDDETVDYDKIRIDLRRVRRHRGYGKNDQFYNPEFADVLDDDKSGLYLDLQAQATARMDNFLKYSDPIWIPSDDTWIGDQEEEEIEEITIPANALSKSQKEHITYLARDSLQRELMYNSSSDPSQYQQPFDEARELLKIQKQFTDFLYGPKKTVRLPGDALYCPPPAHRK